MVYFITVDHQGELPFACKLCDAKYKRAEKLKKHEQQVHLDLKFYCDICGREFNSDENMRNHLRKAHKVSKRKLKNMKQEIENEEKRKKLE